MRVRCSAGPGGWRADSCVLDKVASLFVVRYHACAWQSLYLGRYTTEAAREATEDPAEVLQAVAEGLQPPWQMSSDMSIIT